MEQLLNRKASRGEPLPGPIPPRPYVRRSERDEWVRAEDLVAEYNSTTPQRRVHRRGNKNGTPVPPLGSAEPPRQAPAGFRFATPLEIQGGVALVGAQVFYRWPAEGWQQGRVARACPRGGFSHVVAYGRSSALGAVVVDTLLDAASHGPQGRWLLLLPEDRA